MKILHTSDWHLGHTLYNYDRTEEQMAMLRQMEDIVAEQKPDVFLLCGDVYHTSQPSAAVQTMFTNALVQIHDANPQMTMVITAGNHDSGSKHEIFRTPWKALKVFTIGSVERNMTDEQVDDLIIEVPGKGYVIAVPYVNERNLPEGFFQMLLDRVVERNNDKLPVVMSAHTTVKGCDFTGHDTLRLGSGQDSEFAVGGIDSWDIKDMGEGYDYLALGHIHHGQFVHGGGYFGNAQHRHRVRYCGTPVAISFDENYSHTVSMVEIGKHGDEPKVEEISIETNRPLVTLPTEGQATWEEAKELLRNYPDDIEAYIRLNVMVDDFLPVEANAEAVQLTEGKTCRFCHINAHRSTKTITKTKTLTVEEFKTEEPIELVNRYAQDINFNFDDDMKELFNETLRLIAEEERA